MQEKKDRPEIQRTILFLRKLKDELRNQKIHFDNPTQILTLREKLLYWYRKQKPGLKQNGKIETHAEFVSRVGQEEGILIDSIKMLWHRDEKTGGFKYPS